MTVSAICQRITATSACRAPPHPSRGAVCTGWWTRSLPVTGGEHYDFTAWVRPENIAVPRRSAVARLLWRGVGGAAVLCDAVGTAGPASNGRSAAEPHYPYDDPPTSSGWHRVHGCYRAPRDATTAVIELSLRWAPNARVQFAGIELQRAPAPPPARPVRLATAHYRPEAGTSQAEKREQFVPLVEKVRRTSPPSWPSQLVLIRLSFCWHSLIVSIEHLLKGEGGAVE